MVGRGVLRPRLWTGRDLNLIGHPFSEVWLATSRVQGGRSPTDLPAPFSPDLDDSPRIFLDFILDGLLSLPVPYM